MNSLLINDEKLEWKEAFSVQVKEIDDQHKQLIEIINNLMYAVNTTPKKEMIEEIVTKIVRYKTYHFATEEKYFHLFNYEGASEHEQQHRDFNAKISEIQIKNKDDTIQYAFALIDFLEDWLIHHLMTMDQKYVTCFKAHGLK